MLTILRSSRSAIPIRSLFASVPIERPSDAKCPIGQCLSSKVIYSPKPQIAHSTQKDSIDPKVTTMEFCQSRFPGYVPPGFYQLHKPGYIATESLEVPKGSYLDSKVVTSDMYLKSDATMIFLILLIIYITFWS
jgi:hypothetical protein